ncbi:nuclear factor of activated T-cells 5 [Platysternon megacephalum]|uniref:Palmitoyltransferase n=1 Tax=Platysternon megacephalum TaxID=55544 RepID=A0A4D9E3L5_9SAUR|nr:nuclear factor of activated T-cells 5 [Platysternon megacephalum]
MPVFAPPAVPIAYHSCSWLAVHVSLAFPLVAGILFIPAVANLLLASFTDPGILHRGAEGRAGLVIQALRVKERRFDLHWCQKCQYYCPPRTFHCPWCNVCVEEFDHHCKWLNNCIGCRNFRFFFLFVAFLCGYNVVVLASCITYLVLNSHQAYGAEKICAIMVTIPAALYLLPLLILVGSQATFITLAKRTYELKLREEGRANPFDLGWARNWYAALCAPQGPKYMVRAAEPKAATRRGRKASVARLLPQISRLNTAPPGLSSHRCPQDLPGQGRAAQAGTIDPGMSGSSSSVRPLPGWRQGDLVAGKPREEDERGDDRHGEGRRRRTLEIPNTQQQQSGLAHGRAPFSV